MPAISKALYKLLAKMRGETPVKDYPATKTIEHMIKEITKEVEEGQSQGMLDEFIAGDLKKVTYNGELVPHRAFQFKKNLKEVYLPNAIYIGGSAFFNEKGVSASAFDPEEQEAFDELVLEKVIAPEITTIDNNAFLYSNIKEFIHGDKLVFIGIRAFIGCSNLTYFKLSPSVVSIGDQAFYSIPILNVDMTDFKIDDVPPTGPVGITGVFDETNSNLKFYFSSQEVLDKFASTTDWSAFASHFIVGDVPTSENEASVE